MPSPALSPVAEAMAKLDRAYSAFATTDDDSSENHLDALHARIRGFGLFADCDAACLRRIAYEATWFGLPGGTDLDRQGENDQAIFLVVSGRLAVHVTDENGVDRIVAHVPAGETVGEMSMIAGDAHSARLRAMRDTELLRLSKAAFLRITAREPRIMTTLTRLIIKRLRATTAGNAALMRPKTFALIPLDHGVDAESFAYDLSRALTALGLSYALFDESHAGEQAENFYNAEQASDVVIYVGDHARSAWSDHCIRQADRVMLIGRAGAMQTHGVLHRTAAGGRRYELVALHDGDLGSTPRGAAEMWHNVRRGNHGDVARLARLMTGNATGLVLAGGGARGFAHIGAIRALREAGLVFDRTAGSSIGAIIAASVAMGWDDDELKSRIRAAFLDAKPLTDYTLPLVALLRGSKVGHQLQKHFGERHIEDLPLPFFCITSNLTTGHAAAHRTGLLWRALKASASIPGLLPPVVMDGHLHVDGGIMNNMPADVMATDARGPIVAIDVGGDAGLGYHEENYGEEGWLTRWTRRRAGAPSMASLLMRTGTVGNETQRRIARAQADLVIDPALNGISLTHWKKFDCAVEAGYEAVARMIDTKGLPQFVTSAAA